MEFYLTVFLSLEQSPVPGTYQSHKCLMNDLAPEGIRRPRVSFTYSIGYRGSKLFSSVKFYSDLPVLWKWHYFCLTIKEKTKTPCYHQESHWSECTSWNDYLLFTSVNCAKEQERQLFSLSSSNNLSAEYISPILYVLSSTPKAAFLYFSQQFSNWGGEFLSKSLGAILNSELIRFIIKGACGVGWGGLGRLRTTISDLRFSYSNRHSFNEGNGVPAKYAGYPTKYQ